MNEVVFRSEAPEINLQTWQTLALMSSTTQIAFGSSEDVPEYAGVFSVRGLAPISSSGSPDSTTTDSCLELIIVGVAERWARTLDEVQRLDKHILVGEHIDKAQLRSSLLALHSCQRCPKPSSNLSSPAKSLSRRAHRPAISSRKIVYRRAFIHP
jgi:hypothetical protein